MDNTCGYALTFHVDASSSQQVRAGQPLRKLYSRYMFDWETRLTTRDTNRVIRPFEWGLDWSRSWPNGDHPAPEPLPDNNDFAANERYLRSITKRILANSDSFYSYEKPEDFRLVNRVVPGERQSSLTLQFTSPVHTPHPVNNTVSARWFPAKQPTKKAVVLLPHWNSKPDSYLSLCRILARLGISTLRLSLPYHDSRLTADTARSDYAVSPNIGRTINATRQAVVDTRCCYDWLEQQGYDSFGIVGTSLGSCYAFLASAHDERIRVNAFNHASTYVADVVWTGQSTRHVRAGIEPAIDLDRLRHAWDAISPMNYFSKFRQKAKKILVIYATYDLTFLPEYSLQVVDQFAAHGIDHTVKILPCGHYSTGETPFKFMDGWHIGKFLKTSL
jgi:dienelactone hydrolase